MKALIIKIKKKKHKNTIILNKTPKGIQIN